MIKLSLECSLFAPKLLSCDASTKYYLSKEFNKIAKYLATLLTEQYPETAWIKNRDKASRFIVG
jgi:hypothetical protein